MARRLVEAGVRFVTVHYDCVDGYSWDSHRNNADVAKHLLPTLDQTLSALLTDLDERGLLDALPAAPEAEPEACAQNDGVNEILDRWVWKLSDKQREVVERRFGLHGYRRLTLEEIGREIGVTRERVRQIQIEALRNLKQMLESHGVDSRAVLD